MRVTEPYTIFPRKMKSGRVVYYYHFRDELNHRATAHSTGCTTLAQARRFCNNLYNTNTFPTLKSNSTFGNFANGFFDEGSEFCRWKQINGNPLKPETLRRYKVSVKYQIMPFFELMLMNDITTSKIKEWIIWASERWSAKTVNNAQGVLNLIFDSAVEQKVISSNPITKQVKYRKIKRRERNLLTVDELRALYQCEWATQQEKNAFLTAVVTGMRIGEVCAMRKSDVHPNYLDVKYTLSERYGLGSTKTNTNRYVPIPNGLQFDTTDSEWAFCAVDSNEPLKPHSIYNCMIRRCEALGINTKERGITVHTLRNFFISYLQGENIPLQKIKAVVGHADKDMTDWYTYWKPEMFSEVYAIQEKLLRQITASKE